MNSVLVEFEDGIREIISRRALNSVNARRKSEGEMKALPYIGVSLPERFTAGKQNIAYLPPLLVGILVGKGNNPC